jgi:hypothetical protein
VIGPAAAGIFNSFIFKELISPIIFSFFALKEKEFLHLT